MENTNATALVIDVVKEIQFNEATRTFELEMTKIANSSEYRTTLENDLSIFLKNTSNDISDRYKCYYILSILYRTRLEFKQFSELINNYRDEFKDYKSFNHILLCFELEKLNIGDFSNFYSFRDLLDLGIENINNMPDNVGVLHAYCDLVATIHEQLYINDSFDFEISQDDYKSAYNYINKALRIENYPKFYSTKARILLINKEYVLAHENIAKAINNEPSSSNNYSVKIMRYYRIKNMIDDIKTSNLLAEESRKIAQKSAEIEKKLEESTTKSIEIIGFFAGILSFIISSITLAEGENAVSLITILMGSCIVVYSCFFILLHKWERENIIKCFSTIAIGILIMFGGFYVGYIM